MTKKKSKKPVKKTKQPVKKAVKKKRRKINRWIQLKSILWTEAKDNGFDYRSKEFNKVVSNVYDSLGYNDKTSKVYGKDPNKIIKKQIFGAFEGSLQSMSASNQQEHIVYFQLNDKINEYKDKPELAGWSVKNNLSSALPMTSEFKLSGYNYYKSGIRSFVSDLDRLRKLSGNTNTPEPSITITTDGYNETIVIADANDMSTSLGKTLSKNAITGKTLTPAKMKSIKKQVTDLKDELSTTKKDARVINKVIKELVKHPRKNKEEIKKYSTVVQLNISEQKTIKQNIKYLENQQELNKKAINKKKAQARAKKKGK